MLCRSTICGLMFTANVYATFSSGFGLGSGFGSGTGNCEGVFNRTDNCDYYLRTLDGAYDCAILEDKFGMNCTACACKTSTATVVNTAKTTLTTATSGSGIGSGSRVRAGEGRRYV